MRNFTKYTAIAVTGFLLLSGLAACFFEDPGRLNLRYPGDIDYYSAYFGEENSWGNWGAQHIEFMDEYAVLASSELVILDVSDPPAPDKVGSLDTGCHQVDKLVIHDNFAILACQFSGVKIFDISEPTQPISVGSFVHTNDRNTSIIATENYIYFYAPERIATPLDQSGSGWYRDRPRWFVLDISNPEMIKFVQEITDLAEPFAIDENYIYAASRWYNGDNQSGSKFQIIDITDKMNPIVIHESERDEWIFDIVVQDQIAYVSMGTGFDILDVSNGHSPHILNESLGNIGSFRHIDVEDDLLVGDFIWALDVEEPHHIQPLATLDLNKLNSLICREGTLEPKQADALCPTNFRNGQPNDTALHRGLIYIITEDTGLLIFAQPAH